MAKATSALHDALMRTAARLRGGATYQWSHMGACNCGHLAQTVTRVSRAELHAMALERAGDWSEQVVEYCPTSGLPIDHVIATMLTIGLTTEDLAHLERLTAPEVLELLPPDERQLDYRKRDDVVRYLETWAALLAHQLHEGHQTMHGGRGPDQRGEGMPHGSTVTTSAPELGRPRRDDVDNVTCLRNGEPGADRELGDGHGVGAAETGKAA
ncbi:MAG: hypothetical protein ACAI38_17000 [Myxococcota bacterium]|nr:hypothetical protein [Myxococcota bacterium]